MKHGRFTARRLGQRDRGHRLLTSPALSDVILDLTGEGQLSFFDAIAPIVPLESVDMDVAWRQSRYDKEGPGGDAAAYINCPMDRAQYEAFIDALLAGPKSEFKDWEHVPYFDGCLPIEALPRRGHLHPAPHGR